MDPLHVSLIQNCAHSDSRDNLAAIEALLEALGPPTQASRLIALTETFAIRASQAEQLSHAQNDADSVCAWMSTLATQHKSWVMGGIIEKDGTHIYNTCVVYNPTGHEVTRYRKIHLFHAHLSDGRQVDERELYSPGTKPTLVNIHGWQVGLSICYDLRFPELYRYYADRGADIIVAPSNFTKLTGQAHWDLLTRSRAVENQCFMLAPNQCGTNPASEVESYGHSLIIDPWGTIMEQAKETPTGISAILDPTALHAARNTLPALEHRRL